jgi:benzylsuccinate CoA-transferase BbsE subunit
MAAIPQRPYGGVRIIDLTRELGCYATRLFADLGADVIKVEKPKAQADRRAPPALPGADPAVFGGLPFAFLNANKRSVALDYDAPAGREVLLELIGKADIVVHEAERDDGLLPAIVALPGRRIVTAISYFGLSGPYAHFAGSDLVAQALGGIAWLTGEPGKPPLRLAGDQSLFVTSLYAAAAAAIAFWDSELRGNAHVIDVSAQECIAHSLQNTLQVFDLEGRVPARGGEGTRDSTENSFACADGFVFLAAPLSLPASWSGLVNWLREEGCENAQRLTEPDWQDRPTRATAAMKAEFRLLFEKVLANRTMQDVAAEALRRKIVLAPVSRVSDLTQNPQLVFRRYFRKLNIPALGREVTFPGAPYRLSEPVWSVDRAAPRLGQDTDDVLADKSASARSAG